MDLWRRGRRNQNPDCLVQCRHVDDTWLPVPKALDHSPRGPAGQLCLGGPAPAQPVLLCCGDWHAALTCSARSSPTWSPHMASCMAPSTPSPLSRTLVSWCCRWLPPATPRYCPALGPEAAPSPSALALALWPWTYVGSLPSGTTCSFLMGLPGSSWTSRVICALNFSPNRPVAPQSRSCLAPWLLLPQHPRM